MHQLHEFLPAIEVDYYRMSHFYHPTDANFKLSILLGL